jgi:2-oxoisovalerate dehydrogenase E1 component
MWFLPCGGGTQAGPFHSQTNEAWFTKTPGLKVVYPAFPYDAKGLLNASINDPNPVLFLNTNNCIVASIKKYQRLLYLPLGKAALLKEGNEVTIIALEQQCIGLWIHYQIILKFQQIY